MRKILAGTAVLLAIAAAAQAGIHQQTTRLECASTGGLTCCGEPSVTADP